ncbi:DUF6384 family protein [Pseudomonas chlororaphis]|uniref:DUF6384 family protein n=1 Tax=Pseudomonas chlororaphis TaxID=587753 RepID=UPI0007B377C3|nr:DUF6384 family protein [Pseudomonas chlororaphis]AZC49169.1 hypothetical protein C4K35_1571 [Pseudomonas chlororaphis subsp. piscium]AZC55797.1 hypothetical protein C4K34_1617 [Pseudomonas chlororaphis subsp. piscium]AZC62056.1 hypothetical protein C4K33_1549 [Pseudomonas chlororaphis subsp. piscium]AZC68296.1 hypothetical protein C4K32_1619 [Pseudomonas chlororaphis subsp. piscium]AZC74484.1 hypothetical protein C4K31_1566 [Pseudomonas chlororaphis subsp. piscium]
MSQVSLTEQMGAMALIDELRHSQAEVQKHLDLPRHRQLVAERIREFYRSRGIEVEDALVEEGVRNFFAARFTYQPPRIDLLSRLLAELYISRGKWRRPATIAFVLSGVVAFGFSFSSSFFDGVKTGLIRSKAERAQELAQSQAVQLEQLQKRLSVLEADVFAANLPAAERMFEQARERLSQARGLRTTIPLKVTAESRKNDQVLVERANQNLQRGAADLQAVEAGLSDVSQLLAADSKLRELLATTRFTSLGNTYPVLVTVATNARAALDHADTQGVPAARTAVDKLGALIPRIDMIGPYLTRLQDAQNGVREMGLSQKDSAPFQPLLAEVNEAVLGLDTEAAERALQEIERLKAFAAKRVNFHVVSSMGKDAMIERNSGSAGSKAWYFVSKAVDEQGDEVPMPFIDFKTRERVYVSVFAIRVDQATYERNKGELSLVGLMFDQVMGKKDANSLTYELADGLFKGKPEFLLEW